jgi:hypothetical protein
MLKRVYNLFFDPIIRGDLWWNLKRVVVEHLYSEELREIGAHIDREDYLWAKAQIDNLRRLDWQMHYLEPALIRLETFASFLSDDN